MCIRNLAVVGALFASLVRGGQSGFGQNDDGSILPFPPTPSGSKAARTMQESTYNPLPKPKRLPDDAPNILIILIDDAGPGLPDTYGGEVHTPTLTRIAKTGVSFNRFHTTSICSPTRAALLTGRNHHRIGQGVITGLANDWDGYTYRNVASNQRIIGPGFR